MINSAKVIIKESFKDKEIKHIINLPSIHFGKGTLGMMVTKNNEEEIGIYCKTIEEGTSEVDFENNLTEFEPQMLLNFKDAKALRRIGEYFISIADVDNKKENP